MMNETLSQYGCSKQSAEASHWMYVIQAVIAMFIILENFVMITAIIHNWYNLTRQHNMYRYLVSLVVADLLSGVILLVHAILTAVNIIVMDRESLLRDELKDVANNLISGVLHGSCFASLASASLLNIVMRMTYTRALARAAAIEGDRPRRFSFIRLPSLRCPKTTRVLIGFIWTLTLTFIVTPLKMHCHQHITRCSADFKTYKIIITTGMAEGVEGLQGTAHEVDAGKLDCSFLRPPNSRSYILVLCFCITISWCLMIVCNMMTICIKTTVKKTVRAFSGEVILTLTHKPGLTWDTSSLLVGIITVTMTVSTIPYVVFGFVTEGGMLDQRKYYAKNLAPNTVMFFEMTTSISSLLNPFIYTAMLSKLRSDIARLIDLCHKSAFQVGVECTRCCCFVCSNSGNAIKETSKPVLNSSETLSGISTKGCKKSESSVALRTDCETKYADSRIVKHVISCKAPDGDDPAALVGAEG